MTNVEVVHAVYARLENRPGSLDLLARTLGQHKINIDALALETEGGRGFARVMTTKTKEAIEHLRGAGIDAHETQLALVKLTNRPGNLAKATAELAAAGLNVESVVTTADGRLAIRTNDVEMAAQVLRKL